jgi:FMNH2-dependent dimethyl sulfone monooxygenase
VQRPRLLTMSAASSPAGRAFALKTSDLLVTVLGDAGEGLAPVRAMAAQRNAEGRPLQIITTTHVVCRETDREAEDYYHRYAVENADTDAVDYHMNMSRKNRQLDTNEIFNEHKRYAGGCLSSHPLIGRPEKIVDGAAAAQCRRDRQRHAVPYQLQGRVAVLHRPRAAAAAAGGLAAISV